MSLEQFYTGLALEGWRRAHTPEESEDEADFLARVFLPNSDLEDAHAQEAGGARLLDLPCGNGRLALPLARRGFQVTGLDLSRDFVEEGQSEAQAEGLAVDLKLRDMRNLTELGTFDGAYCFGNSFGVFARQGTQEFFQSLGSALREGAPFVLDTEMVAECLLPNLEGHAWMRLGDLLVLVEHFYHPWEGRLDSSYTFIQGEHREVHQAQHWIYTVTDIRTMLAQVGIQTLELFSDLEEAPFEAGATRLILVGEKAEAVDMNKAFNPES